MKDLYGNHTDLNTDWQIITGNFIDSNLIVNDTVVLAFGLLAGPGHVVEYPVEMDLALNTKPSTYTFEVEVDYAPDFVGFVIP